RPCHRARAAQGLGDNARALPRARLHGHDHGVRARQHRADRRKRCKPRAGRSAAARGHRVGEPVSRTVTSGTRERCPWSYAGMNDAYVRYHDEEWGVPRRDERTLFEFLVLEGAQAGLSWSTILNKRDGYREAFDDFDAERV